VRSPLDPRGAKALTIDQAKRAVALHYGVRDEQVEISLRG
jgi:hypothetical protein